LHYMLLILSNYDSMTGWQLTISISTYDLLHIEWRINHFSIPQDIYGYGYTRPYLCFFVLYVTVSLPYHYESKYDYIAPL